MPPEPPRGYRLRRAFIRTPPFVKSWIRPALPLWRDDDPCIEVKIRAIVWIAAAVVGGRKVRLDRMSKSLPGYLLSLNS